MKTTIQPVVLIVIIAAASLLRGAYGGSLIVIFNAVRLLRPRMGT